MAGAIVDDDGTVLGRHDGMHRFTVGQHRGLGNLARDGKRDKLLRHRDRSGARRGPRRPARGRRAHASSRSATCAGCRRRATALDARRPGPPPRHADRRRSVTIDGDRARVALAEPTVAAPGQAAVIYDGDRVLAGGWIV